MLDRPRRDPLRPRTFAARATAGHPGKAGNALFATLLCEPVPELAGDAYAKIKRGQQQRGHTLDENDLWIAATPSALGATLVTTDTDFQRISGLQSSNWTA